jgi:hypothetical protein
VRFQFPKGVLDGGFHLVAVPGLIGKIGAPGFGWEPFGWYADSIRFAAHLGRLPFAAYALHIVAKNIEGVGVGLDI